MKRHLGSGWGRAPLRKVSTGVGADFRQKPTNKQIRLKNNCKSWKYFFFFFFFLAKERVEWGKQDRALPTGTDWSICLCHFNPSRRPVYHTAWMMGLESWHCQHQGVCREHFIDSAALWVYPCPVLSSFLRTPTMRNTEKQSESPRLVRIISLETGRNPIWLDK